MVMPNLFIPPCETAGRAHEHRVAALAWRLYRVVRTDCFVLWLNDHFSLHATHQSRGGRNFDALLGQGNKESQVPLALDD